MPTPQTRIFWLALLAVGAATTAAAVEPLRHQVHGDNLQLACMQPIAETLTCDYRLFRPATVLAAAASVGDVALDPPTLGESAAGTTAIAILVDTSNPALADRLGHARSRVLALIDTARPARQLALGAFGTALHWRAPFGAPADRLRDAALKIKAAPAHPELYRNAVRAIRILSANQARRRGLVVFSANEVSTEAYSHRDVVDAARASGIVVFGVGFAGSAGAHAALERFSLETGGSFTYLGSKDSDAAEVEAWAANTLELLENGGELSVGLGPAARAGLLGAQTVRVLLTLRDGLASAQAPVTIRGPEHSDTAVGAVELELTKVLEQRPDASGERARPSRIGEMLWYIIAALGVAVIAAIALSAYLLGRGRKPAPTAPREATAPAQEHDGDETFGFLEMEDGTRHMLDSDVYLIGRHSSNDLTIPDASVSRQHAEIHREPDGRFTITDLDSMNGVFVDNQQLKHAVLSGGELLELGDVSCRFRLLSESELTAGDDLMLGDNDDAPKIA